MDSNVLQLLGLVVAAILPWVNRFAFEGLQLLITKLATLPTIMKVVVGAASGFALTWLAAFLNVPLPGSIEGFTEVSLLGLIEGLASVGLHALRSTERKANEGPTVVFATGASLKIAGPQKR